MTIDLRSRIKFFAENCAVVSPPGRMACARALALAEIRAEELGLEVLWEYEPGDWMDFVGDVDEKEAPAKFESGAWEVLCAHVPDGKGSSLAALGGIILSPDERNYRRVVEAELYSEAIDTMERTA